MPAMVANVGVVRSLAPERRSGTGVGLIPST
jgi:hypothetical protein